MADLNQVKNSFLHTEHQYVTSFLAKKCELATSQGRDRGRVPKITDKERVICLTTQRRTRQRGLKGSIHIFKGVQRHWQSRKSLRLKLLKRLESLTLTDPEYEGGVVELVFHQRSFTGGEQRIAFYLDTEEECNELVGTLFSFCRDHEGVTPQLITESAAAIEHAAVKLPPVPNTSAAPQGPQPGSLQITTNQEFNTITKRGRDTGSEAQWAVKEQQQLQDLLDGVTMGSGTTKELYEGLQAELAALEDANVHQVLESIPASVHITSQLGEALQLVDELDVSLVMFDAKLRHMRRDVSAIEEKNNLLELHARNSQRLVEALETLSEQLFLPPGNEEVLKAKDIGGQSIGVLTAAAWELHHHLQSMTPGQGQGQRQEEKGGIEIHVPDPMRGMKAVTARRRQLQSLMNTFLERATEFLSDEFQRLADSIPASALGAGSVRGPTMRPPSHGIINQRCNDISPLVHAVLTLQPGSKQKLVDRYCRAINALLKKEVNAVAKDLQRHVASADASGISGPAVLARDGSSRTMDRIFSSPMKPLERIDSSPMARSISAAHHQRNFSDLNRQLSPRSSSLKDLGVPVQDAYKMFADAYIPFLMGEAQRCKDLFQLPVAGGEIDQLAGVLFAGTEAGIVSLVDCVKSNRALASVPMLVTTLHWLQMLEGSAWMAPVAAALKQGEGRLQGIFNSFAAERVANIQKFDGKSALGGTGVKGLHIVPIISNIEPLVTRLEDMLIGWQALDACTPSSTPSAASAGLVTPTAAAFRLPRARGGAPPSPFEDIAPGSGQRLGAESSEASSGFGPIPEDSSDVSLSFLTDGTPSGAGTGGGAGGGGPSGSVGGPSQHYSNGASSPNIGLPAGKNPNPKTPVVGVPGAGTPVSVTDRALPLDVVRVQVDDVYQRILGAVMLAVENTAAGDAKHGDRLKLENYAFLRACLEEFKEQAPTLKKFHSDALHREQAALSTYVDQQIEYLKLTKLLDMASRLDEALASGADAQEVAAALPFQPQELKQLVSSSSAGLDKRVLQVYQRIQKHMASSSPHLVDQACGRLKAQCTEKWAAMELQMKEVFGVVVAPSASEVKKQFEACV